MDGCLPAPASRSVAAGGRAVCRLVRRAVASPSFGSDEAGDPLQVWAGRVLPMWIRATRRQALGCQAAEGMASGLVAGGRSDEGRMGRRQSTTGRPLCWRQDEAAAVCQVAIRDRASGWRLRAINLRLGGRMEGAVCSPRFGCEAGRRPEGGRRRSSGQTGSGLGRRLSGRRSRSGGLRGAAQAQAVRRAGRQSGRRRQRGSGVQPRARKPGAEGGTAAWSAATPFRFSAGHTTEVESGHCARWGNGVGLTGD